MSVKNINPPNPDWKPGDRLTTPVGEMLTIDLAELEIVDIYKLMIGAVVPRPIAFVSSISTQGTTNLAPFSYFNAVSSAPPALMFAVTQKPNGENKDTRRNIEETKEFVVNIASTWLAEAVNHCSAPYAHGESEFDKSGLTAVPSDKIKAPRVKESAIQFECTLYDTMQVGAGGIGSSVIIVGEIVAAHIAKHVYRDGKIDLAALSPLSRLAGFGYGTTAEMFELPRARTKDTKPA